MSKPSNQAILAIAHILRRVQTDADFAHHMIATESLRLCFDAYADHHGESSDEVRKRVIENAATRTRKAQIEELRDEVRRLEGRIDDQGGSAPVVKPQAQCDREERQAAVIRDIEEQVRLADLGYGLDLERLHDALEKQYARAR